MTENIILTEFVKISTTVECVEENTKTRFKAWSIYISGTNMGKISILI